MKKIFILFIMLLVFAFPLTAFATVEEGFVEKTETPGETTPVDPTVDDETTNDTTTDKSLTETVFTRAVEWWNEYKAEIVALAGLAVTFVLSLVWSKIKRAMNEILNKVISHGGKTDSLWESSEALIKGYNGQTDEIVNLAGKVSGCEEKVVYTCDRIDEIEKAIGLIARIITTAYTNNAALPQGVKDLINVDCAQCMKITDHNLPENIETETINNDLNEN